MSTPPVQGDLAPGTSFGGFAIEGVLGRGAMGVVYRATDVRLHRAVALKVVAAHLAADEGFRDRFVAEARAAAMVEHTGVVTIYAAGEENDTPFIAMKIVEGPELSDVIAKAGRLAPQEALKILEPVAGGLDAAATAGIVHRDVKPSNILVPTDGSGAVLVDFGIGRIKGSTRATQSGSWIGTPDYVAPEQIRGEEVDGRADQYSLACVLFELLTGNPPFVRGEDMQTLWAHVNEEPRSIVGVVAGASAELDAVIRRGLAKDPDNRFDSATDLISAARAACGLPVIAGATAVPKVDRRGPTGTVVGGDITAAQDSARPRTGTVIADQAASKGRNRRPLMVVLGIAAVVVITGVGFTILARGGDATPQGARVTGSEGATVDTTIDTATAQSQFDDAIDHVGRWRVHAKAPNAVFVAQVRKCIDAGSPAKMETCMKPVVTRLAYFEIAHWFDQSPVDLANAYDLGETDAAFRKQNRVCYTRANRAIELGTRRASQADELYSAYGAGNPERAQAVQVKINTEAPAFDGAWRAFINACGLPAQYNG